MLDSHNIPVNVLYRNCLYATFFESHADNPKLKTAETVSHFELNSSVKQLSRVELARESEK